MPLYACGSNASSQLALGHAADEYTLTPTVFDSSVPPGHVVDLVSASTHALALYALREGGTILLGAGTNTCGQLGGRCALWDAQPQARWKAVDLRTPEMKGEDGWEPSQIAAAWTTSYVIYQRHLEGPAGEEAGQGATSIASAPATRREQALISAGSNDFAELGHGAAYASPPTAHPRRVALDLGEGEEATLLRAVQRHAVVVLRGLKGDRLIGWGASRRGELDPKSAVPSATLPGKGKGKGKAPARPSVSGPIEVLSPAQRIRDVRLGAAHTVVLFEDGTVRAWGADVKGQIRGLDGLRGVRAIAATWNGTYGLDEDGVWAQGSNTHGQLLSADPGGGGGGAGEGGNADRQRVVLPPAFDVTGIVAGTEHVVLCGSVNGENALYTGGWNEHGNLGVGDTEERLGLVRLRVPTEGPSNIWAGCAATWALV
ncbi:alpha tubulin suppressor [Cryptotrichosporon argae]